MQKIDNTSCTCDQCIEGCLRNPGWFGTIEEIMGSAKLLNMSVVQFCKKYLIREQLPWEKGICVPAPRRDFSGEIIFKSKEGIKNHKGFVIATTNHNYVTNAPCIFLNHNFRCVIHNSKPGECRIMFGCKEIGTLFFRVNMTKYWKEHQTWINNIVGVIVNGET